MRVQDLRFLPVHAPDDVADLVHQRFFAAAVHRGERVHRVSGLALRDGEAEFPHFFVDEGVQPRQRILVERPAPRRASDLGQRGTEPPDGFVIRLEILRFPGQEIAALPGLGILDDVEKGDELVLDDQALAHRLVPPLLQLHEQGSRSDDEGQQHEARQERPGPDT